MEPRTRSPLPGLAKVRAPLLVQRRTVELVAAQVGRWGAILEAADVVSEGRTQDEEGARVYYGSTSVLLLKTSAGGTLPDAEVQTLAAILRRDPHVRLRAIRIAHREAQARAGGQLGTLQAEIDVGAGARGVSLLVEVVARLSRGHLRASGSADR
jgi:putative component of toxin-antitoxin plasmid stabilization module